MVKAPPRKRKKSKQNVAMSRPKQKIEITMRKCLKCDWEFMAENKFTRLCNGCFAWSRVVGW